MTTLSISIESVVRSVDECVCGFSLSCFCDNPTSVYTWTNKSFNTAWAFKQNFSNIFFTDLIAFRYSRSSWSGLLSGLFWRAHFFPSPNYTQRCHYRGFCFADGGTIKILVFTAGRMHLLITPPRRQYSLFIISETAKPWRQIKLQNVLDVRVCVCVWLVRQEIHLHCKMYTGRQVYRARCVSLFPPPPPTRRLEASW